MRPPFLLLASLAMLAASYAARAQPRVADVPFQGCKSDGQTGPHRQAEAQVVLGDGISNEISLGLDGPSRADDRLFDGIDPKVDGGQLRCQATSDGGLSRARKPAQNDQHRGISLSREP